MTGEKWTIYWNEYASDTYLYGTKLIFHKKDDVEILCGQMPSGTVMKTWFSKTIFQRNGIEPQLPMIDGESSYEITVNLTCPETETWLMRLVFLDRYAEEAGYLVLKEPVTRFRCPLKTYSYRLELINGGLTEAHFHSVVIREIVEDE